MTGLGVTRAAGRAAALALGLPGAALAADPAGCAEVAGILDKTVEEWPDMLSTKRVKPRLAAQQVATSAGVALRYAVDAGWTEDEQAPILALRETREPGADGQTLSKQEAPAVLLGHARAIAEMLAEKCPETPLADLSDLSTIYPEG